MSEQINPNAEEWMDSVEVEHGDDCWEDWSPALQMSMAWEAATRAVQSELLFADETIDMLLEVQCSDCAQKCLDRMGIDARASYKRLQEQVRKEGLGELPDMDKEQK